MDCRRSSKLDVGSEKMEVNTDDRGYVVNTTEELDEGGSGGNKSG